METTDEIKDLSGHSLRLEEASLSMSGVFHTEIAPDSEHWLV